MADNMDVSEDLKKMKVPELKQALKEKGLSSSGTKPELIKRLTEAMGSSGGSDPVLDEDEILKDDPAPVAAAAPVPPKPSKTPQAVKPDTQPNGVDKQPETIANIQMPADTTVVAKPTEVSKLSEEERLKLRADKFGIASEKAKKDLRAQRFGISSSENKSGSLDTSVPAVDVEKLKKRAERFGVSTSSVTQDELKRKRAERFGTTLSTSTKSNITVNSTDSELEAKKKKRAERFGLT